MNPKLLTATVILTTAVASPALAMGPHARSEAVRHPQQRAQMYQQRAQIHPYSGFWPGDLAAGIVGGAIGTAGAIATAPFRYNGYTYNGYYGPYGYGSGFTCQAGATFIGADGLRHLCQ